MDFESLYKDHADAVYGYLAFKLRDSQLAEDLMQETFLAAHERLDQLRTAGSAKAWLLSIAYNKMVDLLRRRSAELPLQAESLAASGTAAPTLFIREALEQLDELERSIVYGLYVEGLTHRELAEMLGLPEGTVKSKAHYARRRLHRWLEGGSEQCCREKTM